MMKEPKAAYCEKMDISTALNCAHQNVNRARTRSTHRVHHTTCCARSRVEFISILLTNTKPACPEGAESMSRLFPRKTEYQCAGGILRAFPCFLAVMSHPPVRRTECQRRGNLRICTEIWRHMKRRAKQLSRVLRNSATQTRDVCGCSLGTYAIGWFNFSRQDG